MTDNALKPTAPVIPEATRWLALGAVAGPVLFTLAWFVLGFLSPGFTIFGTVIEPYSPVSQPISGLGLGSTAPFMNAAFVLSGILLMAGVIGVFQTMTASGLPAARWACAALLALSPLGLVIAGIFTLVPGLRVLAILGLYSIYLLYLGLPVTMKAPSDRAGAYTGVVILAAFVLFFIIGMIGTRMMGMPI